MITFPHRSAQPRSFLATTAMEECWDKTQPMLFLGEWCTTYENKASWQALDADVLPHPLIDHDPEAVIHHIETVYQSILPSIAQWLNDFHGTQHTVEYWEIIIGSFLFIHIQTVYDRYARLKHAFAQYPHLTTIGLAEDGYITPQTISEYYDFAIQNDYWNLQLCTQIIQYCFMADITCKHLPLPDTIMQSRAAVSSTSSYKFTTRLKLYLTWLLVKYRGSKTIALVQHDFNRDHLWRLMRLSKGRILSTPPREQYQQRLTHTAKNIHHAARTSLSKLTANDTFTKLVISLLGTHLPQSFLEDFSGYRQASKRYFPYFAKAVVGSPVASGETLKIWQADHHAKGMKRIGLQHGGGYGALKSISDEYLEHKTSDIYLTWGQANDHQKVRGLPSVPLCQLMNELVPQQSANTILWVTTEFMRYPMPEVKLALGYGYYEKIYYHWQRQILTAINPSLLAQTIVRLRFSDFSDQWKFVRDALPGVNFHKPTDKSSFYTQIREAKLLLFDNFNTTYLYGLALNIPSLLFFDERIWTIRDDVKPYFDALRACGIFHTTPESVIHMINQIGHDPKSWWQREDVQDARIKYCDFFVGNPQNWLKQWRDGLLSLAMNAVQHTNLQRNDDYTHSELLP